MWTRLVYAVLRLYILISCLCAFSLLSSLDLEQVFVSLVLKELAVIADQCVKHEILHRLHTEFSSLPEAYQLLFFYTLLWTAPVNLIRKLRKTLEHHAGLGAGH